MKLAAVVTTPAGPVTPVVRAADTGTLAEIAGELRRLTADARAGRLPPADYGGIPGVSDAYGHGPGGRNAVPEGDA